MKLDDALRQLSTGRKSKRLNKLLPAIEYKLAEGVTHGDILALLNANGFCLTERTYKSYLYRYRKRRRTSQPVIPPAGRSEQPKAATAAIMNSAVSIVPSPSANSVRGPNTFEFNAGGLPPELLK